MTNYGKKEHIWELRSMLLLTLCVTGVAATWMLQWVWLMWATGLLIIVTFVAHLIARVYHALEKQQYRNRR